MGQVADIIKYEGDNSTFIWKHPLEDFNSLTQLIVHESQEAIFFMNGQALDLFTAGRYTLETQNLPKLSRFLNRVTGDMTPFHCEVYFVNKTEQMSIKWGTDTKVEYMDPQYNFPLSIGACGQMSLQVNDSRKLLLKLVGTENYLSQARLVDYFRAFLMTKIKTYIAQSMKEMAINIFEIDQNLSVFSEDIKKLMLPDFDEYGVTLAHFFVTAILKPEDEPNYKRFKELHYRTVMDISEARLDSQIKLIKAQADADATVIESKAMATKRAQEGYSYINEKGFEVMNNIAQNEGTGSDIRNSLIGFGTGIGAGGVIGGTMAGIASNTFGGMLEGVQSQSMNSSIPGMINLKEDEQLESIAVDLFQEKLKKLKLMREAGVLSDEEFQEQKVILLDMI